MGLGSGVDRSFVSEIAQAARDFEWEWTRSGIEGFLARAGDGARISGTDDRVDCIVLTVAQANGSDEADCRSWLPIANFEVNTELWKLWDAPTGVRVAAEIGASWTFPNVVVGVVAAARSVELWLINPEEQMRLADIERRAIAEFTTSVEWTDTVAAVAVLAQIDPGGWTRADMDRIFDAVGWEREEKNDEYGTVQGGSGTASLRAFRTSDHQRDYGYGEFEAMWLTADLPQEVLDLAYADLLAECVRILGTPSYVGGPKAFATWRRNATTLTLSRGAVMGVEVDLYPTEAKENEEYSNAKWDEYWEPSDFWRIRPDRNSSRADLDSMWYPVDRKVTDWESFDRNVQQLFTSLAADMPVLHPHATSIVWVIVSADEQTLAAQGWFESTRSRVEIKNGDELEFRDFPPGSAAAEEIVKLTQAVVRTVAETPDGLRYYAFAPSTPQALMDFRLGLADSVNR